MAKKVGHRKPRIEHKQRQCPRCDAESPDVKLVLGDKPLKANWCPNCEEVFTQRGVRIHVGKGSFQGMHMAGKGIMK